LIKELFPYICFHAAYDFPYFASPVDESSALWQIFLVFLKKMHKDE